MANEKILNTRIQLRYDSLQNWASTNPTLKEGEIAVAYLPPKGTGTAPAAVSEAVLMKVGPGAFNSLPWASALAADVYTWAKEASLTIIKDGTGNVVSGITWDATANGGKGGIKFTTASVATSEGLAQVQVDLDAVEKDIADNRDAWAKDDNTTYTFVKNGKTVTITASDGTTIAPLTFEYLTEAEVKALKVDAATHADAATKVDSALTVKIGGTNVVYDGSAVKTVDIDTELAKKQNVIAANTYDEYGAAAAVLGTNADAATANTVYGAKAAAKAAQDLADDNKERLDAFFSANAEVDDVVDTLVEIRKYMTDDTQAFTQLSEKVTKIENGTTSTTAGDLTAALEAEIKGYTVAKATDADKLGGTVAASYALKTDAQGYANTAEENAKGYADGLAGNYATKEQGDTADSALQSVKVLGTTLNKTANELTVEAAKTALGLGSAAYTEANAYATSAQGALADTAVQDVTNVANNGLILTKSADKKISVDWDPNVVFVFNCGNASTYVD